MECESCGNEETVMWAHNAGIGAHHWGEGEEKDCSCSPMPICCVCDAPLLKEHAFLVMDSVLFGHTNDTLQ